MFRFSFAAAAAVAALTLATQAPARAADFISGPQLAKACTSKAPADAAACGGYVAGALDEVIGSADLRGKICPPPDTKLVVLREAVGRYAQQHPDEAKGSGTGLLHAMMKANYPCPAAK